MPDVLSLEGDPLSGNGCGSRITFSFSYFLFTYVVFIHLILDGDRGSTVVKVLCYKSEGPWFDPSWCQRIFH